MDIYSRLSKLPKHYNITNSAFDLKCGLSRGWLRKTIERRASPTYKTLKQILFKCEDINPHWLLLNEGEMELAKVNEPDGLKQLKILTKNYKSVIVSDNEGRIMWVNDEFEKQTGYSLEKTKGKHPGDFIRHTDYLGDLSINTCKIKQDTFYNDVLPHYKINDLPVSRKILVVPLKHLKKIIAYLTFANIRRYKKYKLIGWAFIEDIIIMPFEILI
ncbi:PAS domain-containing protein [Thalassobellus citreus]|uniref:PAS domain-containing protein n=1 Tax=Thalassobellus citreus TaxID=3367752 RepID=UPI0037A5FF36